MLPVRKIYKLGDTVYFGKFSKLGEKKCLIRQKKNTLLKTATPVPTFSESFELALLNKDESHIDQLFMRSLNRAI